MKPKKVTTASGKTRWACTQCGSSHADELFADLCCQPLLNLSTDEDVPKPEDCGATGGAQGVPSPKAAELLGRAAMHMHDRAATYDKPEGERSMGRCVEAFNAVTGRDLSESEGWLLMALLKQVRLFTRSGCHADSAEDAIAYMALLAEAKGAGR